MVGHAKTCLVLVGGYLFFPAHGKHNQEQLSMLLQAEPNGFTWEVMQAKLLEDVDDTPLRAELSHRSSDAEAEELAFVHERQHVPLAACRRRDGR